jgi:putative hydrolase
MDLHTHTVASGHGTKDTIGDMVKAAKERGLAVLGISDHGPATPGSCRESYFHGLKAAPNLRGGVLVLYGVEANILNERGRLDIGDETGKNLDFLIASIHEPSFHPSWEMSRQDGQSGAAGRNTAAYVQAMRNPLVKIIGHPDDVRYPVDAKALAEAAADYHVVLEVNEGSLLPGSYRGNTYANMKEILLMCLRYRLPVLLSSDSHGTERLGQVPRALALVKEVAYPQDLIWNFQEPQVFLSYRRG